jgi:hypothetical protein
MHVIGEGDIGADKDIVSESNTIPKLHSALDGHPVANDYIIFNKTMGADITISTNLSTFKYNTKLPNLRIWPQLC